MDISNRKTMDLNGRSVAVIGAARSGLAAAKLLTKLGANVFVSEANEKIEVGELKTIGVPFD